LKASKVSVQIFYMYFCSHLILVFYCVSELALDRGSFFMSSAVLIGHRC